MKSKIRFILPKLIGVTLGIGLLSFVIGLLFKLLIAVTIISAAGIFFVTKIRRRKSNKMLREDHRAISSEFKTDSSTTVHKLSKIVQHTNLAIIPIN